MKQSTITLMTIAILYMMGYSAKERSSKEPFYGKWKCEDELLIFRFNGICKIHNTYGYLKRYDIREEVDGCYYDVLIHQKKQELTFSFRMEDQVIYINAKRYVRM